jgi:hypothetical protein
MMAKCPGSLPGHFFTWDNGLGASVRTMAVSPLPARFPNSICCDRASKGAQHRARTECFRAFAHPAAAATVRRH